MRLRMAYGLTSSLLVLLSVSLANADTGDLPKTIGWHEAKYDAQGKLLPWTSWTDALNREMLWYLDCPLDAHGYPIFVFTTFMKAGYKPYKTEIIPATQNGMGIISYLKYWEYTNHANPKVLEWAKKMGDYLVDETLTPDMGVYPRFTRSTGHHTTFPLVKSSQADEKYGTNVIEPDKGGIAGYALVKLYDATGGERYLAQARHNADVLANTMRAGDAKRAPWPFRVDSVGGQYWGERNGNMVFILRLFDALIAKGDTQYQVSRDILWAWIRDYQLTAPEGREASHWIQFFEDMPEEDNRNAWAPLEMARYLIEQKDVLDPDWKSHAEQCIAFSLKYFSETRPGGVTLVGEQDVDKRAWGGVNSKLGGVAAMFYAAGGGDQYKEMALRNLNWMTYFIREDGIACDMTGEPKVREGGWQEDCHTDVVHNFMDAMQAVPEWGKQEAVYNPKMLAYSASPTPYFNDHAAEVARCYDGFFFVMGDWDEGAAKQLGLDGQPAAPWKDDVRENLKNLRAAGAAENFLGVYFAENGAWPSPDKLLPESYRDKMAARFGAIAGAAKDMGFAGICVDIEYPFPRYALDHAVWTYEGYTAEDLKTAARNQARAITLSMLDAFPEAAIIVLPGSLRCRALAQSFQLGMLSAMAERDAPSGLHLGFERSYCLLEPVSQVGIPREGDLSVRVLEHDPKVLDYWMRRCTVAPGVWPLHMIETGGKDYPVRPWAEEMAELRQQMGILRCVAKRYIWSYSGKPVWHPYTSEVAEQYGLGREPFPEAETVVAAWQQILADKPRTEDPNLVRLIDQAKRFDLGEISGADLCARLGTPAEWLMLGPLANPNINPGFAAPNAWKGPYRASEPIPGRDGVCRWFTFKNYEPMGAVRLSAAFDWMKTDKASFQMVCNVTAPEETPAVIHWNWDDGGMIWLNDTMISDQRSYPERGHGLQYLDRYNFEESKPITLPKGTSRLAALCINSHGSMGINLRITDKDGWPIEGVTFGVPALEP